MRSEPVSTVEQALAAMNKWAKELQDMTRILQAEVDHRRSEREETPDGPPAH